MWIFLILCLGHPSSCKTAVQGVEFSLHDGTECLKNRHFSHMLINQRLSHLNRADVIGLPAWRDQDIDDFIGMAEIEAMADLLEPLPQDKQGPILKKMIAPKKTPQDIEQMFGRVRDHRVEFVGLQCERGNYHP